MEVVVSQTDFTFCSSLVVIKLEGGNDQDLRALDVVGSSSSAAIENDEGDDDAVKPPSKVPESPSSEKKESATSVSGSDTGSKSKKASETKVSSPSFQLTQCRVEYLSANVKAVPLTMAPCRMVPTRTMKPKARRPMGRVRPARRLP